MAMEGFSVDDFKSKGRGPAAGFQKMKDLSFALNNTTLLAATELSACGLLLRRRNPKSRGLKDLWKVN